MLYENITVIDESFDARSGMYLGIRGEVIDYLSDKAPEEHYDEVRSGEGHVACPAFYNIHSHLPMVLLRGYAENLALADWLNTRVFPFEAKIEGEDLYYATLMAQAEALRFGCVSCTEMYFRLPYIFAANEVSGFKLNASNAIVCFGNTDFESLSEYKEYMSCLADPAIAASDRFRLDMAVHAEYTTNPVIVRRAAEFAKEHGMNMHLHMSETMSEHEECKGRHGMTPAAYFESLGAFDVPCTAAHCVHLEGEDFEILARKGVTVANNTVSNLKLASGFANVGAMLKAGINVGLGTDGVASNNNLNMFEELKLFATINKALSGDPTLITPAQALYAATRAGALSQGRKDCGLIKEGFKADIMILDTDNCYMTPVHNMTANIVYSAQGSDVVTTICDGKILYDHGEYTTIDIEKARYEVSSRARRISDSVGG
ncbi:MAG: amidohydrolase [Clostridia bacterium]|nr:amidohydrolase [Clostridia bacterium]